MKEREIAELELSIRARNLLRNSGIKTVGELINKTTQDLININGFGQKVLNEIEEVLAELGLKLASGSGILEEAEINKIMICSALNGFMVAEGENFSVFRNPKWVRVFETQESLINWIKERTK